MVKSVLGVNHQGLRDWLFQRMSAVFMLVCIVALFGYLVMNSDLAYYEWHGLFAQLWVKIVTILFFLSLLVHAWVGMWTVYTDYVTCPVARLVLNTVTFFGLAACFFATLLILWGV